MLCLAPWYPMFCLAYGWEAMFCFACGVLLALGIPREKLCLLGFNLVEVCPAFDALFECIRKMMEAKCHHWPISVDIYDFIIV